MQTWLSLTCRFTISSASPNLTSAAVIHLAHSLVPLHHQPLFLSLSNYANASTWTGAECHLPASLSACADSIFFLFAFRPTFFSASSAR